jgi:hypothetical protein
MPKCSVLKMIHTRCLVIYPVLDKEYITNWQNLMQGHIIMHMFCLAGIVLWRGGGVGANQNTSAQGTEGGWIRAQGRSMMSFV